MPDATLGAVFALVTALCWSVASLFFKRAGETVHPIALGIINCAVGLTLTVLLNLVAGARLVPDAPWQDIALLAASGALGIGIADNLYFLCLNDIGAGRAAIVETAYGPFAVLGAFLYLHERMGMRDVLGAALVVSGIVLVSIEERRQDTSPVSRWRFVRGVVAGICACALFVTAILGVRHIITMHDVRSVALVRMSGGLVATLAICAARPAWMRATATALRPGPSWRFALPGAFFGMFLSMQLWVAGFKYAKASIAAILNQTSSLFIVVLAALFLGEKLTPMKVIAVILGFVGSVLVVS